MDDLSAEVGGGDIFKPTIENDSSHEIVIDNGVRVVNSVNTGSEMKLLTYCLGYDNIVLDQGCRIPNRSVTDVHPTMMQ